MSPVSLVNPSEFIAAMRQVASSVTVVTTDGIAGQAGATVSAFSSLSAKPPSVLICLRTGSRIARVVDRNRAFCVNLLPEGALEIARVFSGARDQDLENRFQDMALTDTPSGPLLPGATGFVCQVANSLDHGTHRIFVGNVAAVRPAELRPLTYLNGAFHTVRPHLFPAGEHQCP